jgi:hypothetical protein
LTRGQRDWGKRNSVNGERLRPGAKLINPKNYGFISPESTIVNVRIGCYSSIAEISRSDRYEADPDRMLNQFGSSLQTQCLHHLVFVRLGCSGRDMQKVSYLFHRPALSDQPQHFALACRQLSVGGCRVIRIAADCPAMHQLCA